MATHRLPEDPRKGFIQVMATWLLGILTSLYVRLRLTDWSEFGAGVVIFLLITSPIWNLAIFFYFFLQR